MGLHVLRVEHWVLAPPAQPRWLMGIVQNDQPVHVTGPEVLVQVRGTGGRLLPRIRAPTFLAALRPGQTSPFRVRIPADTDPAAVQIGCVGDGGGADTVCDLALTDVVVPDDDVVHVTGVVEVPVGLRVSHVVVVGAWYTADDRLCATTLQVRVRPATSIGRTVPYHLRVWGAAAAVRWEVRAQGVCIDP